MIDLETQLKILLASAPADVHEIHTLELSHSAMTKTYYLWREPYAGTITTETGAKTVEVLNFEIKLAGTALGLDQVFSIRIDTTDVEDEFRDQMDRIPLVTLEKVKCIYRSYLSNDLTSIQAKATLEVEAVNYEIGAATLSAVSPRLNINRTGELYTVASIPMLRGFL